MELKELFSRDNYFGPIAVCFLTVIVAFGLLSLTIDVNGEYGIIKDANIVVIIFASYSMWLAWYLGRLDAFDKRIRNHAFRFVIRIFLISLLSIGSFGFTIKALTFIFFCGLLFWPVFNYTYNYFKGSVWSYIGREATFDKIIRAINDIGLIKLYPIWLVILQIGLIIYSLDLISKHY
jgi:hypothetical protein